LNSWRFGDSLNQPPLQEFKTMTITSVLINGTSFASGSEPSLTEGENSPNTFTINGSGFSGNQVPGDVVFGFIDPVYNDPANKITSQTTSQINGNFIYSPSSGPTGGEAHANLAVSVAGGGGTTSFPATNTYPVKVPG
jgi:hypothetical protein